MAARKRSKAPPSGMTSTVEAAKRRAKASRRSTAWVAADMVESATVIGRR